MKRDAAADPGAAFIAACLAPLPPGTPPAECPILRREARRELRDRWHRNWLRLKSVELAMEATRYCRLLQSVNGWPTTMDEEPHRMALLAEIQIMLGTPAPTREDLAFKRRYLGQSLDPASAERAIAADEARLAKGRA